MTRFQEPRRCRFYPFCYCGVFGIFAPAMWICIPWPRDFKRLGRAVIGRFRIVR